MPIGPAAKGIIIVGGVIIAAGIAVYENPQVRDWLDVNRRKASEAFNEFLDNLDPQRRRRAHAHGAHSEGGNSRRTAGAGARREAPPNEEFALERRRLGEEYLEQRRQKEQEYKDRKRRDSLDPATQAAGSSDAQEETKRAATATAVKVRADNGGLRQRPKVEDEAASVLERKHDISNLDVSDAHIQISLSGADWAPEASLPIGNALPQQDPAQPGSSTTDQTHTSPKEEPSTPRLSAQAQVHPEPEFTTPVLSLNLSQYEETREHYQTAPPPGPHQDRSLPQTPSTAGSEMGFSQALRDVDVDESASQMDLDLMSDAGTETASHISRASSFGQIDETEIGEQHMDVDDDVVSVASSWSAVSSRLSER